MTAGVRTNSITYWSTDLRLFNISKLITSSGDRDREIGDGATERHTEKGKE